jgi:hypothetical protein
MATVRIHICRKAGGLKKIRSQHSRMATSTFGKAAMHIRRAEASKKPATDYAKTSVNVKGRQCDDFCHVTILFRTLCM